MAAFENQVYLYRVTHRDTIIMIRSFAHRGLERFFLTGSKAGIRPEHAAKLSRQLAFLDVARTPKDMDYPGWRLHSLTGRMNGHWSIWVSGNWRMTFRFDCEDAEVVDYRDYH
jgi:proteic killer suppression protein